MRGLNRQVVYYRPSEDITNASEQLKALISDLKRPMNEKYRPVRQINTYTSYIITSNRRAVGAFSADDRRMIVVDCPPKMTSPADQALYDTLGQRNGAWFHGGGPRHLLHYLLTLDLKGWRPPSSAPPVKRNRTTPTPTLRRSSTG